MRRIRDTKNPSFRQIDNMVANLQELYGCCANIQTKTYADLSFWISNGNGSFGWFDTWQELQQEYRKIIKAWRGV